MAVLSRRFFLIGAGVTLAASQIPLIASANVVRAISPRWRAIYSIFFAVFPEVDDAVYLKIGRESSERPVMQHGLNGRGIYHWSACDDLHALIVPEVDALKIECDPPLDGCTICLESNFAKPGEKRRKFFERFVYLDGELRQKGKPEASDPADIDWLRAAVA